MTDKLGTTWWDVNPFDPLVEWSNTPLNYTSQVGKIEDVKIHTGVVGTQCSGARGVSAEEAVAHERWLREQAEDLCKAVQDQRDALQRSLESLCAMLLHRYGSDSETGKEAQTRLNASQARPDVVLNRYGYEDHCNLMSPATLNTDEDYCDCSAASPQPQGDASPQVSGGGDAVAVLRDVIDYAESGKVPEPHWVPRIEAIIAALSTPQAQAMNVQAEIQKGHPMRDAWEVYRATPQYANTRAWALKEAHVDGSLWAAFVAGYQSREATNGQE